MLEFLRLEIFSLIPETAFKWIEIASILVEAVAVINILYSLVVGTFRFILLTIPKKQTSKERFNQYKPARPRSYCSAWRLWWQQM